MKMGVLGLIPAGLQDLAEKMRDQEAGKPMTVAGEKPK